MSGATSRRKGKANELEVVHIARAHGHPDAERDWRTPQPNGDIRGLIGNPYLEVRRRERLQIAEWIREVEEAAPNRPRAIAFRRNREPWYAALPLEHYFDLLSNQREEQE